MEIAEKSLAEEVEAWRTLDPLAAELRRDPVPLYHRLQAEDPLHRLASGTYLVTRHADVDLAGRHPDFTREGLMTGSAAHDSAWERLLHGNFEFLDPPAHTRVRNLAQSPFSAKSVASWRPRFEALVDAYLDRVAGQGGMDVVADFAAPLPVAVITDLLGLPAELGELFEGITEILLEMFIPGERSPTFLTRADAVAEDFIDAMGHVIDERRQHPGSDLLTTLIMASDGEDRLSRDELIATCMLVHVAGHETTGNLIANAVLTLLRHPDQLALLRADPSLIRSAVEEVLRFEPSALTAAPARATAPIVTSSGTIPAGAVVQPLTAAACRDPRVHPNPDQFDIRRREPHLAFYAGTHFCMGAMLSRAETQVAIAKLLERFPRLELESDTAEWRNIWSIRALERLPVTWGGG
jgi:cytochrome P450